jgi:protein-tyrosine-phosphatase
MKHPLSNPNPNGVVMARILIVGTSNVCRSAYAGILLGERLHTRSSLSWTVSSAGTAAAAGLPICALVGERLGEDGVWEEAVGHHSRPLERAAVESADLVLTATAAHRAEVALLVPRASVRTFTLLEAVRLGALLPVSVGAGRTPISDLVAELQGARPRLGATPIERHARWRRFSTAAIDLPDAHDRSANDHRTSLARTQEAVDRIADLLVTVG